MLISWARKHCMQRFLRGAYWVAQHIKIIARMKESGEVSEHQTEVQIFSGVICKILFTARTLSCPDRTVVSRRQKQCNQSIRTGWPGFRWHACDQNCYLLLPILVYSADIVLNARLVNSPEAYKNTLLILCMIESPKSAFADDDIVGCGQAPLELNGYIEPT